jgi:hypothetical protein
VRYLFSVPVFNRPGHLNRGRHPQSSVLGVLLPRWRRVAKSFPPVNSCGRRLLLLEPTERLIQWNDVAAASRLVATEYALQSHEDRGPAAQVAVLKQPADKGLDNGQRSATSCAARRLAVVSRPAQPRGHPPLSSRGHPAPPVMPQGRFTASLGRAAGWLPGEPRASASPRPGSCTTGQATGQSTGLLAMDKGQISCFRS